MLHPRWMLSRLSLLVLLACTACGITAPQPTLTPAPTLPPAATPLPTYTATFAPSLTATFTATATQTLIPTITPTNTLVPPPTPAGELVFHDPLDINDHHWNVSPVRREFMPEQYFQVSNNGNFPSYAIVPMGINNFPDVELVVEAKPTSEDPELFFYGIGCRFDTNKWNSIFLGVTPVEGNQYMGGIVKFRNHQPEILMEATLIELPPASSGFGAELHFLCKGDTFKIIGANGQEITATDTEYQHGVVGLALYAPYGFIEKVGFNDLFVYRAP